VSRARGKYVVALLKCPLPYLVKNVPLFESCDGTAIVGLVGTVESALCFPSRCGNPRCKRISISGVRFHKALFSFFFGPFFFLCASLQFSTKN
jgi:hypothetical protein